MEINVTDEFKAYCAELNRLEDERFAKAEASGALFFGEPVYMSAGQAQWYFENGYTAQQAFDDPARQEG